MSVFFLPFFIFFDLKLKLFNMNSSIDVLFFPNRKKSFDDLFKDGILKDKNPF